MGADLSRWTVLRTAVRSTCALVVAAAGVASPASAADATDANALVSAIRHGEPQVSNSIFTTRPSDGSSAVTPSVGGLFLPRDGVRVAVLSTGLASSVTSPGSQTSSSLGGAQVRGASDVSILRANIDVPLGINCLALALAYFTNDTDLTPAGARFRDAFLAELDPARPWNVTGSATFAPADFAIDAQGSPLTSITEGVSTASAAGTSFARATPWSRALTPVSPGAHVLEFSIFDRGDALDDSAVLLDDLRLLRRRANTCPRGLVGDQDVSPPVVSMRPVPSDGGLPTFSGTAGAEQGDAAVVALQIFRGQRPKGRPTEELEAPVDSGAWSAAPRVLPVGDYVALAVQVDATGNVGLSAPTKFTVASPVRAFIVSRRQHGNGVSGTITLAGVNNVVRITLAKSADSRGHSTRIGSAALTFARAGKKHFRIRLNQLGRRELARRGALRATVRAMVTSRGLGSVTVVRTVALRR